MRRIPPLAAAAALFPLAVRAQQSRTPVLGFLASASQARYTTTLDTGSAPVRDLALGATLPRDAKVESVTLDGKKVGWQQRTTNRGKEITTKTGAGRHTVVVTAR